jgi:hypothetical protein
MTTTASLVGASDPKLVQIVVSATTLGVAWTVKGSAGGYEWIVPGGQGVGDGGQLVLADNRGPVNVPITYSYVAGSTQTAAPVTRALTGDIVLQSLDGQRTVIADLMNDTKDTELEIRNAVFSVPGRRRPVVRYSMTGGGGGTLVVRVPTAQAGAFDDLMSDGAPLIWLMSGTIFDFDPVAPFIVTGAKSNGIPEIGKREWMLPYLLVDDPFMDTRLGVYTWDAGFDAELAGRTWNTFDSPNMAGRSWNQFDTLDWPTV